MAGANPRRAALVAVGSELLLGIVTDTNSPLMAGRLADLGMDVDLVLSTRDDVEAVARAITDAADTRQLVIVSGGLGPTFDDVTREGMASALGRRLVRDADTERAVIERYASWGKQTPPFALKQADVMEGATILPATTGTAPGQVLEHAGVHYALLPGVPAELRRMFEHSLVPWLRQTLGLVDRRRARTLRLTGMYEGEVETAMAPVREMHPHVRFTVLSYAEEVHVVLFDPLDDGDKAPLDRVAADAEEALGDAVFGKDQQTLEGAVIGLLAAADQTVATAESCTGGLLAKRLTDVPGASSVFLGGIVAYSQEAKRDWLSVSGQALEDYGQVSSPVASEMAAHVRLSRRATYGLALTGIAGPTGGTDDKPLGLVHLALASEGGVTAARRVFPGDRDGVRQRAAQVALDMLRRAVSEHIGGRRGRA
jgi:nicotinamide-nucleotide amidase